MVGFSSAKLLRQIGACFTAVLAFFVLSSCTGQTWASDEAIEAARYRHGDPAELTLITIVRHGSDRGDHTALLINGSERVMFDPAGSWSLATVPVRNDVHFGMTSAAVASFYASHVRPTHYAVVQRLLVSPEIAAMAQTMALQAGPVASARCAVATSGVLRQLSGFDSIASTWFPGALMRDFARLPDVVTYELHADSPSFDADVLAVQRPL